MNYIFSEEKSLLAEIRSGKHTKEKAEEPKIMKKLFLAVLFVALLSYANLSYGDVIVECPHCSHLVIIDAPIAREAKGAGCYCDGCGHFYCHGDKCPKCGHPRKKLKWDESDGW